MRKTISLPLWWKVRSATYAISVFFLFWVSIRWFNKVWKDVQEKDVAYLTSKWSMWFIHHNAEKQIEPQKKSTFWEYVCYRWKETQCFLYYCYTVNFIFYTIGPRKTPLNGLDNEKCLPFFHTVVVLHVAPITAYYKQLHCSHLLRSFCFHSMFLSPFVDRKQEIPLLFCCLSFL